MRSAVCLLKKRTDDGDPAVILPFLLSIALKLLGAVVAVLAVVATADYLFQYAQWYPRQKMSRQGIKQEFRPTEGDPTIKANARALHATVEIDGKYRRSTTAPSPKASATSCGCGGWRELRGCCDRTRESRKLASAAAAQGARKVHAPLIPAKAGIQ